jgi:branched-chain amino acid transport system permease protein
VYALVAAGYAFIFRTTGSFNFAQGQLFALGGLFAYTFYAKVGLPVIPALILAMAIVGLVGVVVERVAIWPLARRGDTTLKWLISTLGAAILITGIAERIWGTQPLAVENYIGSAVVHLGSVNVATSYVVAFFVAIATALAIEAFQRFTLWGRAMRAVGDNRDAVELAGINVLALGIVAFAVAGVLAGLAGFVLAPVTYAETNSGFTFAILSFAAVAIGGFSSHWGAILGGWLVGVVGALGGTYLGLNYQNLIVFGLLIAVLLIRPEGLMSLRGARQV